MSLLPHSMSTLTLSAFSASDSQHWSGRLLFRTIEIRWLIVIFAAFDFFFGCAVYMRRQKPVSTKPSFLSTPPTRQDQISSRPSIWKGRGKERSSRFSFRTVSAWRRVYSTPPAGNDDGRDHCRFSSFLRIIHPLLHHPPGTMLLQGCLITRQTVGTVTIFDSSFFMLLFEFARIVDT